MTTTSYHSDDTLSLTWERYKAGQCSWAEVQAAQDALMPRCEPHDTPTGMVMTTIVDRRKVQIPICARCIEEAKSSRALFIASQRVIDGGVWLREEV